MTDNRTAELLQELRDLSEDLNPSEIIDHVSITRMGWTFDAQWLDAWHMEFDRIMQAIAATLGDGRLTAEQVRKAIMSADRWEKPMGDTGLTNAHLIIRDDGWQTIADELNSREERMCEFVDDSDSEPSPPKCSVCGYDPGIYECAWYEDGTYGYEQNYCPDCGAKVVSDE